MSVFLAQARRLPLSVFVVLAATLLTNMGMFMVLPFLAVYLTQSLTASASLVGLTIGFTFALSNGGALLAGHYVDRFGAYPLILLGIGLRIASFSLLTVSRDLVVVFAAVQVGAIGNAFYLPAARKAILQLSDRSLYSLAVALSRGSENAGMGLGPLLGAGLFFTDPQGIFFYISLIFVITFFLCAVCVPFKKLQAERGLVRADRRPFSVVLRRRPVMWVSLLLVLHTFLYIPFFSFMPVYIKPVFGSYGIAFLLAFNALSVFLFQPIFSRRITSIPFGASIFMGFSCIGIGIGLYHWLLWQTVLLGTLIITIGEIIGTLRMEYTLTRIGSRFGGTMFGLMRMSFAIGGALGSFFAGFLQTSLAHYGQDPWLFWPIQGGIGIVMGVVLGFLSARKEPFKDQQNSL